MSRRNSGSRPTKKKMEQARRFYEKYGVYKREIVIDEHGVLMDGYTTYLLMCEQGKDMVLVRRIRRQGNELPRSKLRGIEGCNESMKKSL